MDYQKFLEFVDQIKYVLVIILLMNLAIIAVFSRLSNLRNLSGKPYLKREDYWFHLVCLNCAVLLMYVSKQMNVLTGYSQFVRFFIPLIIIYVMAYFWGSFKRLCKKFFG